MAIQIGAKASPTFAQPLELLSDCHRRVENFLRVLIAVAEQAKGGELDSRYREALETALRYFREAAPKHTADEEESLFPRMRALNDPAVGAALEKIDALEADHDRAGHSHDLVERLGQKWLKDGRLESTELEQMVAALKELRSMYEHHIAVEDSEIFPLAGKVLPAEQLQEIGREMARRRGQELRSGPEFKFPRHG